MNRENKEIKHKKNTVFIAIFRLLQMTKKVKLKGEI